MHKLFIDINVALDVALDRAPYAQSSRNLLVYIAEKKAEGFLSAMSYLTLYYLIEKKTNHATATKFIKNILELFSVVPINGETLKKGLQIELEDFEDSVQMACAESCQADYIVTRNVQDFKTGHIPAISPAEYLSAFKITA